MEASITQRGFFQLLGFGWPWARGDERVGHRKAVPGLAKQICFTHTPFMATD
jgi:hypothetical protein